MSAWCKKNHDGSKNLEASNLPYLDPLSSGRGEETEILVGSTASKLARALLFPRLFLKGRGQGEGLRPTLPAAVVVVCFCIFVLFTSAHAADTNALLNSFLDSQKKVTTWSADFVQTRTSKSFTRPLTSSGHVWFAAPNKFHWELGQPAQTIAVRSEDEMLVIYPKLKRVEKYPLNAQAAGQWKDMMALLETGFPRDRAELESRFQIRSITVTGNLAEVAMEPKSSSARKMMPLFKIGFSPTDFSLRATEMQFADGSTMRNDFKEGKINETFDEKLFAPKLDADYKVVEPLKK